MYEVALEILNKLENKGYKAYIVGGYVRDKLLGLNNDDIDIITNAKPDKICNIFNIDRIDNYGSIKLYYKDYYFDVTTFRKEYGYVDGRRPSKIEYVDDLNEDLLRRDFTINSICIDKNGNYIDLLNGIEDLNNGVLRCIGEPDIKLKEDSLRILRAIRFCTLYSLEMDDNLTKSIRENVKYLCNLSFDRIKTELNYIFSSDRCTFGINLINKLNLLKILEIESKISVIPTGNYLSVWAQLNYSDKYNFSNKENKIIKEINEIITKGDINNYVLYKYSLESVIEASKILGMDDDYVKRYNDLIIHSKKDIDLEIGDLEGIISNNKISDIYMDLEYQILYNNLRNEKKDILKYILNKVGDINE